MDAIQVFVPKFRIEECLAEIRECLERGWTGLGYKTVAFEEAWRDYSGLPHAHFLNSATSGLHLAVRLLKEQNGWKEGDEIITTPLTFVSTPHSISYEKLTPVFADVDEYLCLDPASIEERITPRTKAVMFVGLGGNTGQLNEVSYLCRRHRLKLILDAAHMAGTRYRGTHVGQESDVSVFSYQAVKNLPTADSGMICFAEPELDAEVRKWTWLGINKDTYSRTVKQGAYKWHYDVEFEGYKYHGNSIMAALGLVGLRYLDQDNAYRRQLATWYTDLLKSETHVELVPTAPGCESSRHLFQILIDSRDEIMTAFNSADIFPGVHYRDNTNYHMYSYGQGTCPKAWDASLRVISLPMHLGVRYQDLGRITGCLKEILAMKYPGLRKIGA